MFLNNQYKTKEPPIKLVNDPKKSKGKESISVREAVSGKKNYRLSKSK